MKRAIAGGLMLAQIVHTQPIATALQCGADERVLSVRAADVDGDGRSDLAVAVRSVKSQPRRLLVFLQQSDGAPFDASKVQARPLEPDVVALAFVEMDGKPGAELILCTPRALAMVRWPDGEPTAVGACALLWQPGTKDLLVSLQDFVRDLDGDGLQDLLLPEPDGYRVALQRRGDGGARFLLQPLHVPEASDLPAILRGRVDRDDRSLRIAFGDAPQQPLLAVADTCPVPRVLDFDGDRRLDVIALSRPTLHVFVQQGGGTFAPAPTNSLLVAATERTKILEPAFFADAQDFDRDGKADLVVCRAQTRGGDAFESVVEIWSPPFAEVRARLRLQGLAAPPQFDDVDGDGAPDLTIGTLRTDLLSQLGEGGNEVEAQLNVFLLRDGKPQLPAALTWRVRLAPEAAEGARSVAAAFIGDADGDGTNDLMLHDSVRSLRILRGRRDGERLSLEPFWQTALPEGARVPLRVTRSPCDDLVVVSPREVLHVRLR